MKSLQEAALFMAFNEVVAGDAMMDGMKWLACEIYGTTMQQINSEIVKQRDIYMSKM